MNRPPKVEDFFPTEGLSYDITSPQQKRFYGKVKKVGNVWVTPDGMAFQKQHLAYKSVHESYMGKDQLQPLIVPSNTTLEQFFDIRLPRVIKDTYAVSYDTAANTPKQPTYGSFKELLESSQLK